MNAERLCAVEGCTDPYFCGVGMPPKDVCERHFNEYLADAGALFDRLREALR